MTSLKGPGESQRHDGSALRIAIVHARWNSSIIEPLVAGAKAKLLASGVREANIVIQSVPGSWELPIAVQRLYSASQIQSTTAGSGSSLSAGDLLGPSSSSTDLTSSSLTLAPSFGFGSHTSTSISTSISTSTSTIAPTATTTAKGKDSGSIIEEELKQDQEDDDNSTPSTAPFDAIIAIGVLIKGETMHFEYIAEAVSHGLMRVQLDLGVPLIFGLLTVLSEEQARMRAGIGGQDGGEARGAARWGREGHNHGEDWGLAAVELGIRRRQWGEGKIL